MTETAPEITVGLSAIRTGQERSCADDGGIPFATVIVNADDWGRTVEVTDRILECILAGVVSSTSAMVFMEDSERAAALASTHNVDTGLHLNLTDPFSGVNVPVELREAQHKVARYLRSNRLAPRVFNPLLTQALGYVVKAQVDEYARMYGVRPSRIDGHHHMHLAANVILKKLLPGRTIVRRNFTFGASEKGGLNRAYRAYQDRWIARRHRTTDGFYDLLPMEPGRLERILESARTARVEIETHPVKADEYRFLMDGGLLRMAKNVRIARGYHLCSPQAVTRVPAARASKVLPHICVCICTYKRPEPLKRLLAALGTQRSEGLFTYSVVIADNDELEAGRSAVEAMRPQLPYGVKYCVEPSRGIARARNKVIANAQGEFVALIDDDEFPEPDWLLNLLRTYRTYNVDGVLGPVKRYFDHEPPKWLGQSSLYDRPVQPTGLEVRWRQARTGNVLLPRAIFGDEPAPFNPEFRAGEDQDFFHRKIAEGRTFVWSAAAVVYEALPPARWKRGYYVRKALMQGGNAAQQPDCGALSITKSLVAVPLYTLALPFAAVAGQHRFMTLLVKLCDHAGKLLGVVGMNPIREEYVSD